MSITKDVIMIKAVLFDLDGTLADTLEDLAGSGNYTLESLGYPVHKVSAYKYFVGNGIPKLIERILPEAERNESAVNKALNIFMEHYRLHYVDKTKPYEGTVSLINKLSDLGIKTAVVTNKAHEMAERVTEKLFGDSFCAVVGKQESYPAKPDPELTLKTISDLGVKPSECLFVGDSGVDMLTAVNSGCIAVGVLWGFRDEDELRSNGAQYTVSHPDEIISIIGEL